MKLLSPAFADGQAIPARYSCEGADVNPALIIENVPAGTQSLALIMDDPDAPSGTFTHWAMFNLDPATSLIAENNPPKAARGQNSAEEPGYIGPCPPSGRHRYIFTVYALDRALDLPDGVTADRLRSAMADRTIEQARLTGTYQKSLA
ncbi:MAG: YbhB/YbcL family Raf kinase inhibitor-like protein [Candidatus Chaera renei]|uniref:YbhB/YbcL family Raf kinase inhibitor-like protein n=1 Tax=Candidatus Chaera renei TaxID=2506947 RepID=A0A4Q0AJ84_9BACT|nr:MAG: YbhB/YbcL family Raf kinase inhibitor-like protein [Candidatus Chaera renei]